MTVNAPELALLLYAVAEVSMSLAMHGQPKEGRVNFFAQAISWATLLFISPLHYGEMPPGSVLRPREDRDDRA